MTLGAESAAISRLSRDRVGLTSASGHGPLTAGEEGPHATLELAYENKSLERVTPGVDPCLMIDEPTPETLGRAPV